MPAGYFVLLTLLGFVVVVILAGCLSRIGRNVMWVRFVSGGVLAATGLATVLAAMAPDLNPVFAGLAFSAALLATIW